MCEICLKLTIKTPRRCQSRGSAVFINNLDMSHLFLFLTLSLNKKMFDETTIFTRIHIKATDKSNKVLFIKEALK